MDFKAELYSTMGKQGRQKVILGNYLNNIVNGPLPVIINGLRRYRVQVSLSEPWPGSRPSWRDQIQPYLSVQLAPGYTFLVGSYFGSDKDPPEPFLDLYSLLPNPSSPFFINQKH
jgi:hypothetical protein